MKNKYFALFIVSESRVAMSNNLRKLVINKGIDTICLVSTKLILEKCPIEGVDYEILGKFLTNN